MQEPDFSGGDRANARVAKEVIKMYLFSKEDLRKLIIPLILEQILAVLVGLCDTVMVSHVGEAAVSGVSLVDMVNQLAITVFSALATGGAVIASQYLGHNNKKRACESANQLLLVVTAISATVMLLCIVARGPILRLFFGKIESEVMYSALVYFLISALSYPFLAIYNAGAAIFRSMNRSSVTLVISGLMNIVNIIFNSIFIFGFRMGVAGAAIGSLLARAFSAIVISLLLRNEKNEIHFVHFKKPLFEWGLAKKILYIGIPNGIENGIFQLGRIIVVAIIAGFGTTQIAANAVANVFDGIGILPGNAYQLAMITVVGRCVGAGDYKQARYYTRKLVGQCYIILGTLNALLMLTLNLTLRLYALSPETILLAKQLIMIHCGAAIVLWPLSFVLPNTLRASNDVKFTMSISICSMFVFRVLLSLVLAGHFGMGAIGVWLAMIVDWIFRTTLFVIRYRGDKWQRIRLI